MLIYNLIKIEDKNAVYSQLYLSVLHIRMSFVTRGRKTIVPALCNQMFWKSSGRRIKSKTVYTFGSDKWQILFISIQLHFLGYVKYTHTDK